MERSRGLAFLAIFCACLGLVARADPAAVSVDFSTPLPGVKSMSGVLHGLSPNSPATLPDSGFSTPLNFSLWRQGNQNNDVYARVTSSGARFVFVTSDTYGYPHGGNSIVLPGQNGDWTAYDQFVAAQATTAIQNNHNLIWEFWNEPELTFRDSKIGASWPGTKAQFFEAFRHFSQGIRAKLPNALIAGPSPSVYDADFLGQFLDFCKANAIEVNVLTWHEFTSDVREIPQHFNNIRTNYVNNPAYAALHLQQIQINEFLGGGNEQYRPASLLSYLYNFEDAAVNADGVCKSCWSTPDGLQSNCFNGTLGGMLTSGTPQQPRALWWAYKSYADGVGSRVVSTANDVHMLPFASSSTAAGTSQAQVLVGYYDQYDAFSPLTIHAVLTLNGLGSLPFATAAAVHVNVKRIPDTQEAAVTALPVVADLDLPVAGGQTSLTLPAIGLHEAWVVTLRAPGPLPASIPAAPATPGTTPGEAQVALTWPAVTGATSYRLSRATTPGGAASVSYPGITTASFTDLNLTPGQTYYYRVAAVNAAGASGLSAEVSATPPAPSTTQATPPPAPWTASDVGSPDVAGGATYRDGTFTVQAAGADIYGWQDQFQYVWQPLAGDVQIIARVSGIWNTNLWAKAGLMLRSSLDPSAPNILVALTKGHGAAFQSRSSFAAVTAYNTVSWESGVAWLKLTRSGATISGWVSADGSTWSLVNSIAVDLGQNIEVGLAATSHNKSVATTATFDHISFTGTTATTSTPPPPSAVWTSQDVGAPALAGASSFANGIFTVQGAGADINGFQDQFRFVWKLLTGDGQVIAHVNTVGNTDEWAKVGVMMRGGLTGTSAFALMALTPGHGSLFQYRTSDGVNTGYQLAAWPGGPYWVKLVRSGYLFSAYVSADGTAWTLVGSTALAVGEAVYAGLAVTSHNPSALDTATFDNASVTAVNTISYWRVQGGLPADGTGLGADAADPNANGLVNLLDYALGNSPLSAITANRPVVSNPADRLTIAFPRNPALADITYTVEATPDLTANSWTPIARSTAGGAMTNLGGAFSVTESGAPIKAVTVVDGQTQTGHDHRFLRLKITRP